MQGVLATLADRQSIAMKLSSKKSRNVRPRIAVVNSSSFGRVFPEHWNALCEFAEVERVQVPANASPELLLSKLRHVNGILASVNPDFTKEVIEGIPGLVAIARHGIGFNNVDVATASRLGIPVTKVSGPVERISVAEQTIALLFAIARKIPQGDEAVRRGCWAERASFIGVEVMRKRVGVIGVGNIGSLVVSMLAHGFACDVMAYDPYRSEFELRTYGARKVELDELLRTSDIIALQCALTPETRKILNAKAIAKLQKHAIVVNSARGELVDDAAVVKALKAGKFAGYATDVVDGEPIDGNHPLLKAPNCIVTPHLGGYSIESLRGMGETMVEDFRDVFVHGRMPDRHLVDASLAGKPLRPWKAS